MGKIRKRLAEITDLPEASFGSCPRIILNSDSEAVIDECLEIMSYEDNEIRLRLSGLFAVISGSGLSLKSFSCGNITVCGKICGIALSDTRSGVYASENS